LLAAACSATGNPQGTGSGGGGSTATSVADAKLVITPQDGVLELPEGMPASLVFKAALVTPDSMTDVTNSVTWAVDDQTLGSFAGSTFTGLKAGIAQITVTTAQAQSVSTSLTIKTQKTIIVQGAPADAPGKFGGATDASKAPAIVYPPDGVIVPPNLSVLEIQFSPGSGNDLFALDVSAPLLDVSVYFTCTPVGSGCGYTPSQSVWNLIAEAGRGQAPATITLRGVSSASPGGVGVSASQKLGFSKEDLVGGLYYWNAGAGTTMRYEFGKSGQQAETYLNAQKAGALTCVGCHVLSRDGTRIVAGLDIPEPAGFTIFDVATKTALYSEPGLFSGTGANFFSFSPDSKQVMSSNGNSIDLRDTDTGAKITSPLVANGTMPDWSPDGQRMVYAKGTMLPIGGVPTVQNASIELLELVGGTWMPGKTLVPFGGQNNYYPAFSPDGQWVLFNRSPGNHDSFSNASVDMMTNQQPDGELWTVPTAGGTPIKLAAATDPGACQWPKWAPIVNSYHAGQIMWLTFSSMREYGLRLPKGQTSQIWMVGFDPKLAAQGKDPSLPAFWLPFQDIKSGNHIAQWVLKVERKPCGDVSVCDPGEQCIAGTCQPVPK
jgi:TolB protein